jgi:hypothetical protein
VKKLDVRAKLEAIARGEMDAGLAASTISEAVVNGSQDAFRAWREFAQPSAGEPLPAPAALLTPLP